MGKFGRFDKDILQDKYRQGSKEWKVEDEKREKAVREMIKFEDRGVANFIHKHPEANGEQLWEWVNNELAPSNDVIAPSKPEGGGERERGRKLNQFFDRRKGPTGPGYSPQDTNLFP